MNLEYYYVLGFCSYCCIRQQVVLEVQRLDKTMEDVMDSDKGG